MGETTTSVEYGKCLEIGEITKLLEHGKCPEIGGTTKSSDQKNYKIPVSKHFPYLRNFFLFPAQGHFPTGTSRPFNFYVTKENHW